MKGATVWSEHSDLQVAEVFAVQDAIAERIAAAMSPSSCCAMDSRWRRTPAT